MPQLYQPSFSSYSVFSRGFEGETDWVNTQQIGTDAIWSTVSAGTNPTVSPYSGGGMAQFNAYTAATGDAALYSNSTAFTIPASATAATLTFAMYHDTGITTANDTVTPMISTNGSTWTPLGSAISRYAAANSWVMASVDLSSYIGQTAYIGFLGTSAYGDNEYIDSVNISAVVPFLTVTPTASGKGTISPSTPQTIAYGNTTTFTVTPNTGFSASVSGCGGSLSGNTYTTGAITANCTVTASFAATTTYTIPTAVSPAGSGTVSCSPNPVSYAGSSTCTATAGAGYTFVNFTGACTGTTCTLSTVTSQPGTVTANFQQITYTIPTAVSPAGSGTVSCSPNPVAYSGTSTCTAVANTGYTLTNFSGSCSGATCVLSNVTSQPGTVTANFQQITYTIPTAVSPAGSGTVSCSPNPVTYGSSSTCTATANAGYSFANFTGACTGSTCVLSNVTSQPATVTANFTLITYTVTPSAGTGGTISPSVVQTVNYNNTTAFTVTPTTGYTTNLTVGGTCPLGSWSTGNTVWITGAITANCTVSFGFTPIPYSVTPSAGTGGTISPNTVQTVNYGATTAFTVAPSTGYTTNTTVSGTCSQGSWNTGNTVWTTGAITANCTVGFNFTPITYTIATAVNPSGGGTVSCSPNPVTYGGSSTCTATANAGYSFANFTGACTGATCALSNVTTQPGIVTANFTPITYTVTPSAGTGGTISPSTAQQVNYGATTAFTVTPNTGYSIASVTGCNGSLSGNTYTTGAITANCTVTATFSLVSLPNLTPYQPSGWSAPVVVSNQTNAIVDSQPLYNTDILYVDWAVINNGAATAMGPFSYALYIDGAATAVASWTDQSLGAGAVYTVTSFPIGSLSVGTHTIEIFADNTNAVVESNEADNTYSKTITVIAAAISPNTTTNAATAITQTSATLNGTVNDGGYATLIGFDFGQAISYGIEVTPTPDTIPASAGNTPVTANVSGLICQTTYHYRVIAFNFTNGLEYGNDMSFATASCPQPPSKVSVTNLSYVPITLQQSSPGAKPLDSTGSLLINTSVMAQNNSATPTGAVNVSVNNVLQATVYTSQPGQNFQFVANLNLGDSLSASYSGDNNFTGSTNNTTIGDVSNNALTVTVNGSGQGTVTTPQSPPIINCSNNSAASDCQQVFSSAQTASVTLIANSASGSSFGGWSSGGCGTNPTCTVTMNAARTVNATFIGSNNPAASTSAPSVITPLMARLQGTVNDNGTATTAAFQYGTTTGYGSTIAATPSTIAAGSGPTAVSAAIWGLTPNTLYHYRVSATNSAGTTNGGDQSFTTYPAPPLPTTPMTPQLPAKPQLPNAPPLMPRNIAPPTQLMPLPSSKTPQLPDYTGIANYTAVDATQHSATDAVNAVAVVKDTAIASYTGIAFGAACAALAKTLYINHSPPSSVEWSSVHVRSHFIVS